MEYVFCLHRCFNQANLKQTFLRWRRLKILCKQRALSYLTFELDKHFEQPIKQCIKSGLAHRVATNNEDNFTSYCKLTI
jgi:hypothetical protein